MMEYDVPLRRVYVGLRRESIGYMPEDSWLCGRPSVCPTSCADTYATISPIIESGRGSVRARGSTAPAWAKYHASSRLVMFWNQPMFDWRISPVRGSLLCGP